MATATVTISGNVIGLPSGTKALSVNLTSTSAVGQTTDVTLASGDNTIAVPAGTTAVLIVPPPTNAVALRLKGAAGDTGVRLHNTNPSLVALDPGQTTFILNAASGLTATTELSFF